jgi:DNA polymerase-3 subunit gamma/tau
LPPVSVAPVPLPEQPPNASPEALDPPPEQALAAVSAHPGPAPRNEGLDLGSWQKKFTGYVSNPAARLPSVSGGSGASPAASPACDDGDVEALRLEWNLFLDSLQKGSESVLATHLQSCEITACNAKGVLDLVSCRKFSCEELIQAADLVGAKLTAFYHKPLRVRFRYDAEKDACTREKSVFTLFQELTGTNEVVRYIITEFGGELIY